MARGDLVSIIKAKQAQIATLQAELKEAQALLAAVVMATRATSRRRDRSRSSRRRSVRALLHSPTAREAAKVLQKAGRPLHATSIATRMRRTGHRVTLGTLVSTLSRWVRSRSVFYRVGPNTFGLLSHRRRQRPTRRQ